MDDLNRRTAETGTFGIDHTITRKLNDQRAVDALKLLDPNLT